MQAISRSSRLLISTEAAGMGNDQGDIDLVVVLGVDSTEWKAAQKVGWEVRSNVEVRGRRTQRKME